MPDLRAIALDKASKLFHRNGNDDDEEDYLPSGGDISLDDAPQGKKIWVSVGRGWRQGRVLSFDGETYRIQTKRGVVEVGEDRVLTQQERNALNRSPQHTVIRR